MLRYFVLPAAVALIAASTAAYAGGAGCTTCYRLVTHPAVYETVSEQVLVKPARTVARPIPAEYGTVAETVLVSPARKVWQVTYDAHGQPVGCWVTVPAQYATQHRTVLVRPAQVVTEEIPAVYKARHRQVLVEPARSEWVSASAGY